MYPRPSIKEVDETVVHLHLGEARHEIKVVDRSAASRGLMELVERIESLARRKGRAPAGSESMLEALVIENLDAPKGPQKESVAELLSAKGVEFQRLDSQVFRQLKIPPSATDACSWILLPLEDVSSVLSARYVRLGKRH